jgi:hypothetical protein
VKVEIKIKNLKAQQIVFGGDLLGSLIYGLQVDPAFHAVTLEVFRGTRNAIYLGDDFKNRRRF